MREYDKSLREVWKWKEGVDEDLKCLAPKEYVEKLRKDADRILSEGVIQLPLARSDVETPSTS